MSFDLTNYTAVLDQNTKELHALVKSLSDEESAFRPTRGWNILEVLEHILVTERAVLIMLARSSTLRGSSLTVVGDAFLQNFLKDRMNRKYKAPEGLEPKGRIKTSEQFLVELNGQREKLKQNLLTGTIKVDERQFKHLILGEMSVSDWLFFIIRHCERHLDQILEIKARIVSGP